MYQLDYFNNDKYNLNFFGIYFSVLMEQLLNTGSGPSWIIIIMFPTLACAVYKK